MAETTIPGYQIRDGAITDAKIAAGADIATSKLEDGAEFLQRDGSVVATGSLQLGNNKITGLQAGSTTGEAVEYQQMVNAIAAVSEMFKSKAPVRAASTANVTISAPGSAIDGVTLVSGDRILLKNQSTAADNGIYIFNGAASAATRSTDFDSWTEIPGATVVVEEGTANGDAIFLCTSNTGGTLGSTAITFTQVGISSGLAASNFVTREVPSGAINGSNATYTLANTPTAGTESVFVNGILQEPGSGNDYTISGTTITMLSVLLTGDKIVVSYMK